MGTARLGILFLLLFSSCKKYEEIEKGLTDEEKMLYQYFCFSTTDSDLIFKKIMYLEGESATVVIPDSSRKADFWIKLDNDPERRLNNCSLSENYKVNGMRIQVWGIAYSISNKSDKITGAHNDYSGPFLKITTLKPI